MSDARLCKRCGKEMGQYKSGKGRRYRCQPCHTKDVLTKYKSSTHRAIVKYRKSEKYDLARAANAIRRCGVASQTSVRSKRTEEHAHNRRQKWTDEGDAMLLSGKYSEGELCRMLGRTLRGIQHRRLRLRKEKRNE